MMKEKKGEKRFGCIAVEKGFIAPDQLVQALEIQARENVEQGTHRLLGQILADMGLLSQDQVEEILETMSQAMIYVISTGR
ncbi:MAG: hypothetical protein JSW39_15225 [Desulfobacterales bacterium]|nr:MAG: hypothetical protein JSW39_15225 [Desulfobacterales bacterium]